MRPILFVGTDDSIKMIIIVLSMHQDLLTKHIYINRLNKIREIHMTE